MGLDFVILERTVVIFLYLSYFPNHTRSARFSYQDLPVIKEMECSLQISDCLVTWRIHGNNT